MCRPFFIVSLVVLAKLHFGDGVGPYSRDRSLLFRQSLSSTLSPSPSAKLLTQVQGDRFDGTMSASPRSFSSSSERPYSADTAFATPQRRRLADVSTKQSPSDPSQKPDHIQKQNFDDYVESRSDFLVGANVRRGGRRNRSPSGLGRGYYGDGYDASTHKLIARFPDGKQIEIPADLFKPGESVTEAEIQKRLKKREEEMDPLTHQINRGGEVIEQQLPTGGQIVVKISGSNINQRKMNKLRELMTTSINFVFEYPEFKTGLMSRFI